MASIKQAPVIIKLQGLLWECIATAAALRDNAQDDHEPLDPADLLDLIDDHKQILDLLDEAFNLPVGCKDNACTS